MKPLLPWCFECKHFEDMRDGRFRCAAYPDGIPDRAIKEGELHNTHWPEDRGYRFTPVEDAGSQG
jgi:hypothetical protein